MTAPPIEDRITEWRRSLAETMRDIDLDATDAIMRDAETELRQLRARVETLRSSVSILKEQLPHVDVLMDLYNEQDKTASLETQLAEAQGRVRALTEQLECDPRAAMAESFAALAEETNRELVAKLAEVTRERDELATARDDATEHHYRRLQAESALAAQAARVDELERALREAKSALLGWRREEDSEWVDDAETIIDAALEGKR